MRREATFAIAARREIETLWPAGEGSARRYCAADGA